jgi:Methyltransferase domain
VLRSLRQALGNLRRARKPDRLVLVKTLFKTLAHQTDALSTDKQVLWIGVCHTTAPYYARLERGSALVHTIDINPDSHRYGHPVRHSIASATAMQGVYQPHFFDLVFCNGVLGWGIDSPADQRTCFNEMAAVMKPGAVLVLGWNTHKMRDPLCDSSLFDSHFAPHDLPGFGRRMVVQGTTHVYDIFARR